MATSGNSGHSPISSAPYLRHYRILTNKGADDGALIPRRQQQPENPRHSLVSEFGSTLVDWSTGLAGGGASAMTPAGGLGWEEDHLDNDVSDQDLFQESGSRKLHSKGSVCVCVCVCV